MPNLVGQGCGFLDSVVSGSESVEGGLGLKPSA